MCHILGVSTSGYFKYKKMIGRPNKDAILSAEMEAILNEFPFVELYKYTINYPIMTKTY